MGGIFWLFLLPLQRYSRQTYISENALLPGQVHTYFAGSEQNVFRAYREELRLAESLSNGTPTENLTTGWVGAASEIFENAGLPVASQSYRYESAGVIREGTNVYSVLQAPRGDGTEAIILVAPKSNAAGEDNGNGVALLLTLARYFKRRWRTSLLQVGLLERTDFLRVVVVVERHHPATDTRHEQWTAGVDLGLPFYPRFANGRVSSVEIRGNTRRSLYRPSR